MRRSAVVGLFGLLASLSTAVFADPSPWYVGFAAEHSDYGSLPEAASDIPGTSHHANGWSVLGGYQFNTWFSLEASYFDLGSVSANSQAMPTLGYNINYVNRPRLTGESVDAVLKQDLAHGFFVFGKVGVTASRLDQPTVTTITTTFPGQAPQTSVSSADSSIDSANFDYGIGVGYEIESGWTVRLGWTRYQDVGDQRYSGITTALYGDPTDGTGNINSLHLDLLYRF